MAAKNKLVPSVEVLNLFMHDCSTLDGNKNINPYNANFIYIVVLLQFPDKHFALI